MSSKVVWYLRSKAVHPRNPCGMLPSMSTQTWRMKRYSKACWDPVEVTRTQQIRRHLLHLHPLRWQQFLNRRRNGWLRDRLRLPRLRRLAKKTAKVERTCTKRKTSDVVAFFLFLFSLALIRYSTYQRATRSFIICHTFIHSYHKKRPPAGAVAKASKKSKPTNGDEEVVKVPMLTGTLYLYRGIRRRAEFIRRI